MQVICGALVAHRCMYLCATSLQNLAVPQDFSPLSVSLWNDLVDPVFDGVGLADFKNRVIAFLLA